jgi:uncharacterized protein (TIGR00297 family)
MQLSVGFLLAAAISVSAYAARQLTRDGALAATAVGTLVYGFGGWRWAATLLAFFASSSLLGRLVQTTGRQPAGRYAKGARRDAGQVLGNGSVAAGMAVLFYFFPEAPWTWLAFGGAVAAVNADTWATELGILSAGEPRLITSLARRVRPGTSGGISLMGTAAAGAGAALIATLVMLWAPNEDMAPWIPAFAGGLLGAMLDSFLGATVQGQYTCPDDGMETEQYPVHQCGAQTVHSRGWRWLNNDRVNLFCAMAGAVVASLIGLASTIR